MTRASCLKSYDLGKYEGPLWLGLGKFGLRNVSADKARHAEPAIRLPMRYLLLAAGSPTACVQGFLEFLPGVL
jgi:hypothetical protein